MIVFIGDNSADIKMLSIIALLDILVLDPACPLQLEFGEGSSWPEGYGGPKGCGGPVGSS